MKNNEVEEINIKDIILLLLKEKKIIIYAAAIALVLTGMYMFLLPNTRYESSGKIILTVPEATTEVYGKYIFPSTDIRAYVNVLGDKYEGKVKVGIEKDEKYITVTAKGSSPEKAQKLADEAMNKYIETLRIQYKKNAVEVFLKALESHNTQIKEQIAYNNKLIEKLLKAKKSGLISSQGGQGATGAVSFSVAADEAFFTDEVKSGAEYINAKVAIIVAGTAEATQKLELNNKNIEELKIEQQKINEKLDKEDQTELLNGKADVFKKYVSVIEKATLNDKTTGLSPFILIVAGLISGAFIGSFIVLFKEYWKNV